MKSGNAEVVYQGTQSFKDVAVVTCGITESRRQWSEIEKKPVKKFDSSKLEQAIKELPRGLNKKV